MKAEIIRLTPELAKVLLEQNIGNRKMKKAASNSYTKQMKDGIWKENGEPIIIDSNGFIKDGQHRLNAVVSANYSYIVPLITGVDPNVMDTIDTGTNRSLTDVLDLNEFKYPSLMSSAIKVIIKHDRSLIAGRQNGGEKYIITNSIGLEYAKENEEGLYHLCRAVDTIKSTSKASVIGSTDIIWFLYAIAGLEPKLEHLSFLKGMYSGRLGADSATYYAYTKYLNAKVNKVKLDKTYMFNLMARCWKIYADGDVPVKKMTISNDQLIKIN